MLYALTVIVAVLLALTVHLLTAPGLRGTPYLRARIVVVSLIAVLFTGAPSMVSAAEQTPIAAEGWKLVIANPVWTIIVGVLLPFVVGIITKATASDRTKAIIGIVVAAVGALVVRATTVDGAGLIDQALVMDIFLVYAPQLLMYLGVYKKFEINQRLAPNQGLG